MTTPNTLSRDLAILMGGLTLIFLSQMPSLQPFTIWCKTIETIGIGMAGYAPIQIAIYLKEMLSERATRKSIDAMFTKTIKPTCSKQDLPAFIAADVEGCITPPNRAQVDLRKFQKLRGYCEFVKLHPEFPPLVVYTGRSQGYVELLAQCLGMLDNPIDLPFVIENGSALYHPTSKRTTPLVTFDQVKAVKEAQLILSEELPLNTFEPKTYMVTLNPQVAQSIDELREHITLILKERQILDQLTITNTASAVDITPKGVNKLSGLREVLKYYPKDRPSNDLSSIVALGDHISDLAILTQIGRAYCPAENVHTEVRAFVEKQFGPDHVIDAPHIDFVIKVVEIECGVRFI
jgi:hydroxymethylpyrimidine pyrophosphatase-like HAD family hydrolase